MLEEALSQGVPQLASGLSRYFVYYNEERLHQSLDYRTLAVVYRSGWRTAG
jgi:transposase InsO family protein